MNFDGIKQQNHFEMEKFHFVAVEKLENYNFETQQRLVLVTSHRKQFHPLSWHGMAWINWIQTL